MTGYSEVLQVIGAMVIFSLILMTSNSMMLRNTNMEIESELEYEVIALAQDLIDEAKVKQFDANTSDPLPPSEVPNGFTDVSSFGISGDSSEDERHEFNDFDDYNGWSETVQTAQGEFYIKTEVFYVNESTYTSSSTPTRFKKLRVTITSKFLKTESDSLQQYQFDYIKSYYAN